MTDRIDIIQTISKLRALAASAGEAEAFAAMKKADKMMQGYNIAEAELAMAEADGSFQLEIIHENQTGATKNGRNRSKAINTHHALCKFCEVEMCYSHDYSVIHWTGNRADVEMARFLAGLIYESMEREYKRWARKQEAVPRSAKASFQMAMAYRIRERLNQMTAERKAKTKADIAEATNLLEPSEADKVRSDMANGNIRELTSTALVVASIAEVKEREVRMAHHDKHPNLSAGRGFSYRRNSTAMAAGRAAGDRVGLGRPVGASSGKLLS